MVRSSQPGGGAATGGGTGTGGGIATGGGTGTGGNTGTGGGTTTDGGTGTGGATGTGGGSGFNFPPLPETPKKTGCSCTEVPGSLMWAALSGLALIRGRRRS
jgi:uncharacterized protein (TIGR03382 family)